MRVFVTGADGFIGRALTPILLAQGHRVTGLARDAASADRLRERGAEPLLADLRDANALTEAARAAEGVIHLALQLGPDVAAIDRAAITALLAGMRGSGKPYVGASAAGLVGDTGADIVDEARPLPQGGPNGWRVENEALVLAAAADGVRAAAVRPAPMVFGHGGGALLPKLIADARATGAGHHVGNGLQAWSTAYVEDVANLFAAVLEHGKAGETYFAASDEITPWRDIAAAVSHRAGQAGRTASWTVDEAQSVVGFLGGLMAINVRVSNDKARALGWKPSGPNVLDEIARYPAA